MPKVSPIQGNFGTGEIGPLSQGRVDLDRYKSALAKCLNYVPTSQGGLINRPGTRFINAVKNSANKVRLIPFKFSQTDSCILEFGPLYIRVYTQHGLVLDSTGNPYEITTTFTEAELFEINFAQSVDVLYLVHKNHLPQKLSRYGAAQWVLSDIAFSDTVWPPFENSLSVASTYTLTASSVTTNTATLTSPTGAGVIGTVASMANNAGRFEVTMNGPVSGIYAKYTRLNFEATVGTVPFAGDWDVQYIGNNKFILLGSTFSGTYSYPSQTGTAKVAYFNSNHIGRFILLAPLTTGSQAYATITSIINSRSVTVSHNNTITAISYGASYGLWYKTNGPSAVCFFEDRLYFTGTPSKPQRIDGSQVGDYENFNPFGTTGTATPAATASSAINFTLNTSDNNIGKWMFSDEKGLLVGTLASEFVIKSANPQEAISATSISAKPASAIGSADCYPVQAGKAILFVQKSGRKIREFQYFFDVDGFRATDLNALADHITLSGVKQLAFQKDPFPIIWAVRNDGKLVALTYDRDVDNLRAGWHRHELGGTNFVESVAVVPSPDGSRDELWMVVKRKIQGSWVRYVEYMEDFFHDDARLAEAYFVDCGLTYDQSKVITGISNATTAVVTAPAHGLTNGDTVIISNVEGMTEVNEKIFTVANKTTNTFELSGISSATFQTYISGGLVRKRVQNISGLSHLEGQTVTILADGAVQASKVVSSGAISLDTPAGLVHIGLGYFSDGQLLRLDAGAADGTSIGKTRRTNRVGIMVHRSLNLKLGMNFDEMQRLTFRNANDAMGKAPELFSGIISETIAADYDFENQIAFRQDQPLPSTILAIFPQMTTQDR